MKNRTNFLLIIFLIIFLVFVYFWYTKSEEASENILTDTNQEALVENQKKFITAIDKLKNIELDVSFFSSKEFEFLQDLTPDIIYPAELGRKNPFLPF